MAPINKQYLDEIQARLSNITVANGYNHDAKRIERAMLTPFMGHDLPAYNLWATRVENESTSYGNDERTMSVFIEVHDKTHDQPFIDLCDIMAQDLIIGLNRTTASPGVTDDESPDLGGIVDDFNFLGYDYNVGQGQSPFCAILAQFELKYTVDRNEI